MSSIHVGGTPTFRFNVVDSGAVSPITGATLVARFRKPGGSSISRTPTITNGAGGICEYTAVTTDLDVAGQWATQLTVTTAGGQVFPSDWVEFSVYPNIS